MRVSRILLFFCLLCSFLPCFAEAGDDRAILEHCGQPLREDRSVSPVTNEWQRNFYYPNGLVMHFKPFNGGWTLTSAWEKHLPISRSGLAEGHGCVREALAESNASPRPALDPTIASQQEEHPVGSITGIPFLWLIFFLGVTLLLVLFVPSARQRAKKPMLPEPRTLKRKPEVVVRSERESSALHRTSK